MVNLDKKEAVQLKFQFPVNDGLMLLDKDTLKEPLSKNDISFLFSELRAMSNIVVTYYHYHVTCYSDVGVRNSLSSYHPNAFRVVSMPIGFTMTSYSQEKSYDINSKLLCSKKDMDGWDVFYISNQLPKKEIRVIDLESENSLSFMDALPSQETVEILQKCSKTFNQYYSDPTKFYCIQMNIMGVCYSKDVNLPHLLNKSIELGVISNIPFTYLYGESQAIVGNIVIEPVYFRYKFFIDNLVLDDDVLVTTSQNVALIPAIMINDKGIFNIRSHQMHDGFWTYKAAQGKKMKPQINKVFKDSEESIYITDLPKQSNFIKKTETVKIGFRENASQCFIALKSDNLRTCDDPRIRKEEILGYLNKVSSQGVVADKKCVLLYEKYTDKNLMPILLSTKNVAGVYYKKDGSSEVDSRYEITLENTSNVDVLDVFSQPNFSIKRNEGLNKFVKNYDQYISSFPKIDPSKTDNISKMQSVINNILSQKLNKQEITKIDLKNMLINYSYNSECLSVCIEHEIIDNNQQTYYEGECFNRVMQVHNLDNLDNLDVSFIKQDL